jgi:hypothetical protein
MSVSPAATSEQLFTRDRAVEYCHSRGLEKVTANTIVRAAYYSGKLARPQIIGNTAYWTKSALDKWIATA